MSEWTDHVERWKNCCACPLHAQRGRIVLARGTVPCDVLFVGEAPGASEDAIGLPFVGPAGRLLDQIVGGALSADVRYAMTNLVCCFPREAKAEGYNEPSHDEILSCRRRLTEFVNLARPRLIVCVGSLAAAYTDHAAGVCCIDIVHPAAILRMPLAQRQMATQKSIVVLRSAVEDVLQSGQQFTKWGSHAEVKSRRTPVF